MKSLNRFSISVLILMNLGVSGCKEPEITVTSLSSGKSLPAPVLLTNGLDSNFPDDQKFLRFTGSCHSKVNGFEIAYLQPEPVGLPAYQIISAITEYDSNNDFTLDTIFTNDLNCSDGTFDFILSLDMVLNHLGFSSPSQLQGAGIKALYIRGISDNERTLPLILSTDDGGSQTPSYLTLETENFHRVIMANAVCSPVEVDFLGENYESLDSQRIQNGSYQLEMSSTIDGTYSTIPIYNDIMSCTANAGATSSQQISSSGSGRRVYLNFSGIEGIRYIRARSASITFDGATYSLQSRAPRMIYKVPLALETNSRFLALTTFPHRIIHDRCYEVGLQYISGNGSLSSTDLQNELNNLQLEYFLYDGSGDAFVTSPFGLYTDSSCSSIVNRSTLTWSNGQARLYLRYSSVGTDPNRWGMARIKVAVPSGTGGGQNVYPTSRKVYSEPDSAAVPTFAVVRDNFDPNVTSGICQVVTLELNSSNFTPVTSASTVNVSLSSSASTDINFYDNDSCSNSPSAGFRSIVFAPSTFSRRVSYRLMRELTSPFSLETSISSFNSQTVIKNASAGFILSTSINMDSNVLNLSSCNPVRITVNLQGGIIPTLGRDFVMTNPNFTYHINSNCSDAGLPSGNAIRLNPDATGIYRVFARPTSSGSQTIGLTLPGGIFSSNPVNVTVSSP